MDDVLDRELSRLARPSPVRVDVARRVLAETGAAGAVDRRAVLPSQLAWASVWAYALALTLAILGAGILVSAPRSLHDLGYYSDGLPAAAAALAQPLTLVLVALEAMGRVVVEILEVISLLLVTIQPVAQFMMMLALALMLVVTMFVIGRDLRLSPAPARKEQG